MLLSSPIVTSPDEIDTCCPLCAQARPCNNVHAYIVHAWFKVRIEGQGSIVILSLKAKQGS